MATSARSRPRSTRSDRASRADPCRSRPSVVPSPTAFRATIADVRCWRITSQPCGGSTLPSSKGLPPIRNGSHRGRARLVRRCSAPGCGPAAAPRRAALRARRANRWRRVTMTGVVSAVRRTRLSLDVGRPGPALAGLLRRHRGGEPDRDHPVRRDGRVHPAVAVRERPPVTWQRLHEALTGVGEGRVPRSTGSPTRGDRPPRLP